MIALSRVECSTLRQNGYNNTNLSKIHENIFIFVLQTNRIQIIVKLIASYQYSLLLLLLLLPPSVLIFVNSQFPKTMSTEY